MNHHFTRMWRVFIVAFCFGLLVTAIGTLPAAAAPTCITDCYVDPLGSDANDGATAATPFKSIQLAINTVSPGGTVHLAAGTYFENAPTGWRELYITRSLTLLGAGSGITIIELPMKMNGIEIYGANLDITLEGMTLTKQAANPFAATFNVRAAESASSFTNMTFRDVESAYAADRNAILGAAGTFAAVRVEDSNFHHGAYWGLSINGPAAAITVDNSHFDNNGLPTSSHAIGFDIDAANNVNITDSTFNNNNGADTSTSKGINFLRTTNAVLDGIEVTDNYAGIVIWEWLGTTSNITIRNSTITDNTQGILFSAETGKTISGMTITRNDLSDNSYAGVVIRRAAGWGEGVIEDVMINRNNLAGNAFGIVSVFAYEEAGGTCNWWGDASGPGPAGPGSGSGVSAGVDFAPYLSTSDLDGLCAEGIFMSTTLPGTTGDGLAFGMEDIIVWDGVAWSMWFDGSDAGLAPVGKWKHNINAFWIPDPNGEEVILSFTQNRRLVPDIADLVNGMDLVRWDGSAFSLWFDGEDVGLNQMTPEKIDALHVLPGSASPIGGNCLSYLLISTQGTGRVANHDGTSLRFRGEDVLGFCMTNAGNNTAGFWHMALDGSAVGMPPNATDSISMSADGRTMYLTTRKAFNVGAASGSHSMVYTYDMVSGTFAGPIFDAPANGLPVRVDGLDITELP